MASNAPATTDAVPYAAVDPHYARRIRALLATPTSRRTTRRAPVTARPTQGPLTCANADAWPTPYDVDTSSAYLNLLADLALDEAASQHLQAA